MIRNPCPPQGIIKWGHFRPSNIDPKQCFKPIFGETSGFNHPIRIHFLGSVQNQVCWGRDNLNRTSKTEFRLLRRYERNFKFITINPQNKLPNFNIFLRQRIKIVQQQVPIS
uniref:Uncharacterized protein n=1 Tax=Opuntia streptacantha TaxID=393608 RepID=A0A7C9AS41_OPUST